MEDDGLRWHGPGTTGFVGPQPGDGRVCSCEHRLRHRRRAVPPAQLGIRLGLHATERDRPKNLVGHRTEQPELVDPVAAGRIPDKPDTDLYGLEPLAGPQVPTPTLRHKPPGHACTVPISEGVDKFANLGI